LDPPNIPVIPPFGAGRGGTSLASRRPAFLDSLPKLSCPLLRNGSPLGLISLRMRRFHTLASFPLPIITCIPCKEGAEKCRQRSAGFFSVVVSAQTPQDDKQVLAECAISCSDLGHCWRVAMSLGKLCLRHDNVQGTAFQK